jgi:hypothetical protein
MARCKLAKGSFNVTSALNAGTGFRIKPNESQNDNFFCFKLVTSQQTPFLNNPFQTR